MPTKCAVSSCPNPHRVGPLLDGERGLHRDATLALLRHAAHKANIAMVAPLGAPAVLDDPARWQMRERIACERLGLCGSLRLPASQASKTSPFSLPPRQ